MSSSESTPFVGTNQTSGILGGSSAPPPSEEPLYEDAANSPKARKIQWAFVSVVGIMVLITLIISIARGISVPSNSALYFMMGLSLLGFVAMEIFLVIFIRQEALRVDKIWFLYAVGVGVMIEALFLDILLFK